jgi:carboxymethylenebutenolidase
MIPITRNILTFCLACLATFTLASMQLAAQEEEKVQRKTVSGMRVLHLAGDSVVVHYAYPSMQAKRPAILVLHDRFGLHAYIHSALNVLASVGYRAYAFPLLSADSITATGYPPVSFDSSDIARLTQIAVEVMSEDGCNGRLGLLGFDVGAALAIETVARIPFIKACVGFYPSGGTATLSRLAFAQSPILLGVAGEDTECDIADVAAMREILLDQGFTPRVQHYKDTKRFFFNPEHEHYSSPTIRVAWNELIRFFHNSL